MQLILEQFEISSLFTPNDESVDPTHVVCFW
jgi:hypothetical protein